MSYHLHTTVELVVSAVVGVASTPLPQYLGTISLLSGSHPHELNILNGRGSISLTVVRTKLAHVAVYASWPSMPSLQGSWWQEFSLAPVIVDESRTLRSRSFW